MKTIHVHTPFTLTTDDGQLKKFVTGQHRVDDAVAEHWFVKAHAEQTDSVFSEDNGDIQPLKAELLEKQKRIDELTAQVEDLESQLATLLSGGDEDEDEDDAGKSKSARRK
ncbi:hypothetical protein ACH7OW_004455 [Escherichia coli]